MIDIAGVEELDNFIITENDNNNIILLYFGATWCGPCKQLKKRLVENDTQNIMPKLVVAHLDIDEELNEKLVKRYKITSLPTQVFIKLNENKVIEISRIEGYDFTKLKLEYDLILNNYL
jgi:thiol-disulfide isomerase/thioredoxin